MDEAYDVVVVGAGIGGLTVGSLLKKYGDFKNGILLVEQSDRVGGRASSLTGEELTERGADWYCNEFLAKQYSYLPKENRKALNRLIEKNMLKGFVLDTGYHVASFNGEGYFRELSLALGGLDVPFYPFDTSYIINNEFIKEYPPHMLKIPEMIQEELSRVDKTFVDFFCDDDGNLIVDDALLDEYDKVSIHEQLIRKGMTPETTPIAYQAMRCTGTLFATISDPRDVSVGDLIRYLVNIMIPRMTELMTENREGYIGGVVPNGVMAWSEAVLNKFVELGGTCSLSTKLAGVDVNRETRKVAGVDLLLEDGSSKHVNCDKVILNIPIQEIFKYLPEHHFKEDFIRRIKSLYGYGSMSPYIALNNIDMIPEEQRAVLVRTPEILPDSMIEGFNYELFMAWQIQNVIEPSFVKEGACAKYLLSAYVPLTEEESRSEVLVNKAMHAVSDFLEKTYPGFKEAIVWELYPVCTRLEGVAKSTSQAGSLKPGIKCEDVQGLYFSGDTVTSYSVGMDAACSSGLICAEKILSE
jgi:hypothetical protein